MTYTTEQMALMKKVARAEAEWAASLVEAPVEGLLLLAVRIDQSGGDSGGVRDKVKALQAAALAIRESAEFRLLSNAVCGA